jgi:hypothetical protein
VLRTWDLWKPGAPARLEATIADRNLTAQWAGLIAYWLLLPLAVAGAVILRRRGQAPLRIVLAPVALVVLVAVAGYGSTRFRVPAEVPLVVLAAVTLAVIGPARRAGRPASVPGPPRGAPGDVRERGGAVS